MKEKTYTIKITPANEFQKKTIESIMGAVCLVVESQFKKSHSKNKITITIS